MTESYKGDQLQEPEIVAVAIDDAVAVPIEPGIATTTDPVASVPPSAPQAPPETSAPNAPTALIHSSATPVGDEGFDCSLCGNTKIRGLRPGRNVIFSLCGDTELVVRQQQPEQPQHQEPQNQQQQNQAIVSSVFLLKLCGDTMVFVPKGTAVVVNRCLLCGDKDVDYDETSLTASSPQVRLTVIMLCGTVLVRNIEDMEEYSKSCGVLNVI